MPIIHVTCRVLLATAASFAIGIATPVSAQVMLGPLPPLGGATSAQTPATPQTGEPLRWTQEDVTPEEKLATAQKEARAAYQVELDICKIMHPSEQAACVAQAKADFQQEMGDIRARFGIAR